MVGADNSAQWWLGHAHCRVGDPIRFLLVFIPRFVDCRFRLYSSGFARRYGNAGKIMSESK